MGLTAPGCAELGPPGCGCFLRELYREATPLTQGRVVRRPIRHPVPLLGDVVTASGISLEGHGRGSFLRRRWTPTISSPGYQLAHPCNKAGQRPHRPANPGAGHPAADRLRVVAPAGARTEPDGSALARAQAADGSQPTGRVHRCPRRRCRGLGSDADAATGASQGWHDVQTLLAQKAVAELLATYLALTIVLTVGALRY